MAKFRKTNIGITKIENREGGEAYKQSDKLGFISLLLTSCLKDKFYESEEEQLERLKSFIESVKDKKFIAKAAIYARNEFGMRSITHVVAAEIAHIVKGESWTRKAIAKIVHRPDDMLEILAYYMNTYSKPIPNSLKKGLREAILKFNAYQLAKYRGENSAIKMVDLFNLVHPVPSAEMKETYKMLMEGKLKSNDTWEAKQTKAGQIVKDIKDEPEKTNKLAELKKENWKELILTRKLGYFALLRNLRNILQQAPELVDEARKMLVEENLIKKSLILPFRFLTAYTQLQIIDGSSRILESISKALDISFANVPVLEGKTLVVVDHSASMGNSYDSNFMKGALFGIIMTKVNDADFMHFGDEAKYISFNLADSSLTIADWLDGLNEGINEVGHGTNFHSIFEIANKKYDRIVIFSDMQGWIGYSTPTSSFQEYKIRTGANPHIYSVDLAGYGDMQFSENQVYCLTGFSEKIFELMKLIEQDKQVLISKIEQIEI